MRTGLTIEDLGDLLELPILAILATHRADGSADAFAASFKAPRLVIRLVPDRIRAWDFRDDVEAAREAGL